MPPDSELYQGLDYWLFAKAKLLVAVSSVAPRLPHSLAKESKTRWARPFVPFSAKRGSRPKDELWSWLWRDCLRFTDLLKSSTTIPLNGSEIGHKKICFNSLQALYVEFLTVDS